MKEKGLIPKDYGEEKSPYAIAADVVDAVRWQDLKNEELKNLKLKDINNKRPWLDELLENFIAFDLNPSNSPEDAKTILKELEKQIAAMEDGNFGPDARNYIFSLKRELELLSEKL